MKKILTTIVLVLLVASTTFANSWGFTLGNGMGFFFGGGNNNWNNNWNGNCYRQPVVYYNNSGYYYNNNCNPNAFVGRVYQGANGAAIYQRANGQVWYQNRY